ncbi:helix-turn-helix domain-containing protein [Micavibrio aeruginosavorus]|uniref:helix-turn-helix domain-containing protein n=1 Tax=Micavibrio aeruginosavorus TaxID=349221 RepID=UPI003F4AC74F
MADEIMTIREVASYLKLAEKSLYRYALEGKVPGFRVGAAWRFRKSDIDAWISKNIAEQRKAG